MRRGSFGSGAILRLSSVRPPAPQGNREGGPLHMSLRGAQESKCMGTGEAFIPRGGDSVGMFP